MLIERARNDEIPKDAIRMTKDEVHEYMVDRIIKWPNTQDIWALKLGNPILSSAVVLSSTVILNFYRKKLKLKNYGRFTLFLPVVFIPSIFNQIYQNSTTTKAIILQDDCPTCITTQSIFIQLGTGIFYPLLGTIGGTYMLATKMSTFALKGNNGIDIAKGFAMHVMKTSQPLYNRLTIFALGHICLSSLITHYQTKQVEYLGFKLLEQHKEDLEQYQQKKENQNKLPNI